MHQPLDSMMRAPEVERDGEISEKSGMKGKFNLIFILSLITLGSIGGIVKTYVRSVGGNVRSTTSRRDRASYTPLIATFNSSLSSSPLTPSTGSSMTRLGENLQIINKNSLPIYLLQMSTNQTAQTVWGDIAKEWNRTAQYDDLFLQGTIIPSLPLPTRSQTKSSPHLRRPVIMIHCAPKMGSTTLRKACRFNLQQTCGVPRTGNFPMGYKDEKALYSLIQNCTKTSHFCAKGVGMPPDVSSYDDVMFIHMFPFRNYDEWATSALKQQYDRGGQKTCNKTKTLFETCKPSGMEIDFRQYGKTALSKFKEDVVQRMKYSNEQHMFLLYHHRELNEVLSELSIYYNIPLLPGSDGKGKLKRPEGTCDGDLLQMYHDCFSSELMELT